MQDSDAKNHASVLGLITPYVVQIFPFQQTKLVKHQLFGMAACLLTQIHAQKNPHAICMEVSTSQLR